ncbi:MAG: Hsp20/alpha crystallin family protein [Gemmatimonadaceae bacterium]|nr:Hsp20/alpha crystallin family protein [Gemmatimonadaceae bacterium]
MATNLIRRPAWAAPMFASRLRTMFDDPFMGALTEPLKLEGLPESIGWMPAVDVMENGNEYMFKVELPGMKREDVTVTWEKEVLTIRGEKVREEKGKENGERFHLYERTYGEFNRTFTFPAAVVPDKITAEMTDGILTVKVPKAPEAKAASRRIEIKPK